MTHLRYTDLQRQDARAGLPTFELTADQLRKVLKENPQQKKTKTNPGKQSAK